jgi:hypothetical protein
VSSKILILLLFLPAFLFAKAEGSSIWLSAMTSTSVAIMWTTAHSDPGTVYYGENIDCPEALASATKLVPATTVAGDTSAYIHEAKLTGLRPGTSYHYRIVKDGTIKDGTITTQSSNKEVYRFALTSNPNALVPSKAQRTWKSITAAEPEFVLIAGDISNNASNNDYRKFFSRAQPLLSTVPFYTVQGNHDDRTWSVYDAWVNNEMPDRHSERFYAFDIGPAHFVAINDNVPRESNFPVAWFEKTLADSKALWTVVLMNGNYRKYKFMQGLLDRNKAHIDVILTSGGGAQYVDSDGIFRVESGGGAYVYHIIEMSPTLFRATLYTSEGERKSGKLVTK